MTTIPKAAIDAAAKTISDGYENAFPSAISWTRKTAKAAIFAALPHLTAPALIDGIRRILDERSAWIARPNAEVDQAIALAAGCTALRIMGAWDRDETDPPAPAVPDGWKLVPIEPTNEMTDAGIDAWNKSPLAVVRQYRAMIAAAPEPPVVHHEAPIYDAQAPSPITDAPQTAAQPKSTEWPVRVSEVAGTILTELGFAVSPSLEPYADRRRDRIADIVQAFVFAECEATLHSAQAAAWRWLPIDPHPPVSVNRGSGMTMHPTMTTETLWVRDADGRVYEAWWVDATDEMGRTYWWDCDGENICDPVEWMPHPLWRPELAAKGP